MSTLKNPTITILPFNVGGNSFVLRKGFSDLGFTAQAISFVDTYMHYPCDKFIFSSSDSFYAREIKKLFALRYVFTSDIVIFTFGSFLFSPCHFVPLSDSLFKRFLCVFYIPYSFILFVFEILALKLTSTHLVIVYQGDDVRPSSHRYSQLSNASEYSPIVFRDLFADFCKSLKAFLFTKLIPSTYYLNPDLAQYLPPTSIFLPYSNVVLPTSTFTPISYVSPHSKDVFRIGHAPSSRTVKGSSYVFDVLEDLQRDGYPVELILIENTKNSDAMALYPTLDLMIDQLVIGWYGGLAVECMSLGIPVMCYINPTDLQKIPFDMQSDLPILRTHPSTLQYDILSFFNLDYKSVLEIKNASLLFVYRWHHPKIIASLLASRFPSNLLPC